MDGARLQTVVHRGYGIAARKVGLTYAVHRPASAMTPLAGAPLAIVKASAQPYRSSFAWRFQPEHRDALREMLLDARAFRHGDYLVGDDGTYGLLSIGHAVPPLAVACNRTVTVLKPGPSSPPLGLAPYGGNTAAIETAVMQGWPCSIRLSHGGATQAHLPGDGGALGAQLIMPAPDVSVSIGSGYHVVDDLGNRFTVSNAERSELGWRLGLMQAVT